MVLTVSFVLSPVTGLFCHRRPRINVLPAPGRADTTSANLTPASGRQDHTTSPYAAVPFVSSPFDRSRTSTRETRPASRCAPDTAASTAPHPASVTIAIRPSGGVGWREFVEMICPTGEAKYFCSEDWTTQISHNKSPCTRNGRGGKFGQFSLRRQRNRAADARAASARLQGRRANWRRRSDCTATLRTTDLTSVEPSGFGTESGSELYFDRAVHRPAGADDVEVD